MGLTKDAFQHEAGRAAGDAQDLGGLRQVEILVQEIRQAALRGSELIKAPNKSTEGIPPCTSHGNRVRLK